MIRFWAGTAAVVVMGAFASQAFAQAGNASRGQRVFNQQCRSCHTVEPGGASVAGPNLHGVFGRKAGTVQGFAFSEAMINSQIVWNDQTMADYCAAPRNLVPGTSMVFNGVKNTGQLADLVAYLKQATQ